MEAQDLDIRKEIMQNMQDSSPEQIDQTISQAIQSGEEKVLLGLGVLFELLWRESSTQEKEQMTRHMHQALQNNVSAQ